MDSTLQQQIQGMIDTSLKSSFTQRRIGDTPTDTLQLTPKKYVASLVSANVTSIVTQYTSSILAVNNRMYPGYVKSTGAAGTPFPSGWTTSVLGTGNYQVIHNLNNTNNYVITATPFAANGAANDATYPVTTTLAPNSFQITWAETTTPATAINTDFTFILMTT